MPITVDIVDSIDLFCEQLHQDAVKAVHASAERLRAGAEDESAIESSAQAHGIYIVTSEGSDYSQKVAEAQGLYADYYGQEAEYPALPEIAPPTDDLEVLIAVSAAYGATNEYMHQAFLTPAGEAERPRFLDALKEIGDGT